MASPSPSAVTRLIEKTDTSVKPVTTHRVKKVPSTDITPTISGSPAATRPPKTRTNSSRVIGTATLSALDRSSLMVVDTSRKTGACPPAVTVMAPLSPVKRSRIGWTALSTVSSSPAIRATISAERPSVERSGATCPSDQ